MRPGVQTANFMKLPFKSFSFWGYLFFALFITSSAFWSSCEKQTPQDQPPEQYKTTPTTYTVTLSNSGGSFTITGATNVTISLPDGTIVFPKTQSDTTITFPPLGDTSAGRPIVFGVNTNHWQPQQNKFQSVRCYLPIGWAFTEKGFYGQPLKQAQKTFLGVDDYLVAMKAANVDVLLCLMQSPDWLNGHSVGINTNDFPPIRPGLNRQDPKSYSEIASIYKAFAIRYGSRQWPVGSYKIDPAGPRWTNDQPQTFKSGLNLVKFIEVGNELDRWWKIGTPEYMTAPEHAAFLISVYDSIKLADPSLVVVMAGLTNYDIKYLNEMKSFCDQRGRKFPCDVVNVHHYSNNGNIAGVHPPTWWVNNACSPESDKDMVTLAACVAFGKNIGLPTWLTEFGFDTEPNSQMSPTPINGQTNEQTAAQWNVRTALESVRLGASRSYVFTLADEPNPSAGLFQSCGLLLPEFMAYGTKPSFNEYVRLNTELAGFRYIGDESTPTVRVLKFKHQNGTTKFAYWLPTSNKSTVGISISNTQTTATETVQYLTVKKT